LEKTLLDLFDELRQKTPLETKIRNFSGESTGVALGRDPRISVK
jgi:hypothetical protein